MSTSCYWNINIVNKLHQEDTSLDPYKIRIGLSVLTDKLLDYFKNDSDALVKTDKIINNISAEQFRSYMNEINSDRKDAHLDFIKEAKKSKIDFNKKEPEIKQGVSELFESNPELANAVYEALGLSTINESEITYTDEDGNPCAKMGGRSSKFTKGSKWEVVKDLKGYPSHEQGGVDIKLGKNGFSFTRNNGVIEAKHGLVLPKIK